LVDQALIGRKMAQMETYLGQVKEFSNVSIGAYKKDWRTQRIVERTLQILIELCMDIANHIISDGKMRLLAGYADIFKVLMENRVIDKRLWSGMEKMAKFRNVVVHQYEKVDPAIVVSILHKNLSDFEKYQKAIAKFLGSTKEKD
jgi:uncharacterized protein YutE (UPF0331/DUF86 family)